jgi:predicted nuclease of predicted toxin-antitoxin system
MKIKLDENLPARLKPLLSDLGHNVDTVGSEGLNGCPDPVVWKEAKTAGRFFITQDLDFSDISRFTPGTHPGILLVRLREPGRGALLRKVADLFASEAVETWRGGFVVATDHKVRVHSA